MGLELSKADLAGIEAFIHEYEQRPDAHLAAVRRLKALLQEVHIQAAMLSKASTALYVVLQVGHRGCYEISEEALQQFGFDKPIQSAGVGITFDYARRVQIYSVPPDERRIYVDQGDDKPFFGPDDNAPAQF